MAVTTEVVYETGVALVAVVQSSQVPVDEAEVVVVVEAVADLVQPTVVFLELVVVDELGSLLAPQPDVALAMDEVVVVVASHAAATEAKAAAATIPVNFILILVGLDGFE